MQKSIIILLCCLFSIYHLNAQELILNGDFENYSTCPVWQGELNTCNNWVAPSTATPDYFNSCGTPWSGVPNNIGGNQNTHSGNAYAGIILNELPSETWREYIQTELISPLTVGKQYRLQMYVNLADFSQYNTDAFGALFSTYPISRTDYYRFTQTPQMLNNASGFGVTKNDWTLISMSFISDSAYTHVTLGNFFDGANTSMLTLGGFGMAVAYYYIDDVSLTPYMEIDGGTSICIGNSSTLYATNDTLFNWATELDPNTIFSSDSIVTVTPSITTTYFVYGTYDTLAITVEVNSPPSPYLGEDTVLCENSISTLTLAKNYTNYLWQDKSSLPFLVINEPGKYWVNVSNNCGSNTDTINISLADCECRIYAPNSFTPNNDGTNDQFAPVFSCKNIEVISFIIFNRWGKQLFNTSQLRNWDGYYKGSKVKSGIYTWKIIYKDKLNTTKKKFGHISVLQ